MESIENEYPLYGGQEICMAVDENLKKILEINDNCALFMYMEGKYTNHICSVIIRESEYFTHLPINDCIEEKKSILYVVENNEEIRMIEKIDISPSLNYINDYIEEYSKNIINNIKENKCMIEDISELYNKNNSYLISNESIENFDLKLSIILDKYKHIENINEISCTNSEILFKNLDRKCLLLTKSVLQNGEITDTSFIYDINSENYNEKYKHSIFLKQYISSNIFYLTYSSSNTDYDVEDLIEILMTFMDEISKSNVFENDKTRSKTVCMLKKDKSKCYKKPCQKRESGKESKLNSSKSIILKKPSKDSSSTSIERSKSDLKKPKMLSPSKEGQLNKKDNIPSSKSARESIKFSPVDKKTLKKDDDDVEISYSDFLAKEMQTINNDKSFQTFNVNSTKQKQSKFKLAIKSFISKRSQDHSSSSNSWNINKSLSNSDIKSTKVNNDNMTSFKSSMNINNNSIQNNLNQYMLLDINQDKILSDSDTWSGMADDKILKKMNKKEIKKQDCIYETIKTEFNYVKTLKTIYKLYYNGLLTHLNLPKNIVDRLIPKIVELITLHGPFLALLTQKMNVSNNLMIIDIGDILLSQFSGTISEQLINVYSYICSHQSESVELYKDILKTNKLFAKFIEECKNFQFLRRLSIPECITYINQRIVKYPLLIESIFKNSKDTDPDYQSINKALIQCRNVVYQINITVRKEDNKKVLNGYLEKIEPKSEYIDKEKNKIKLSHMLQDVELIEHAQAKIKSKFKILDVIIIALNQYILLLSETNNKLQFYQLDLKTPILFYSDLLLRSVATDTKNLFIVDKKNTEIYEIIFNSEKEVVNWNALITSMSQQMSTASKTCSSTADDKIKQEEIIKVIQKSIPTLVSEYKSLQKRIEYNYTSIKHLEKNKIESCLNNEYESIALVLEESFCLRKKKINSPIFSRYNRSSRSSTILNMNENPTKKLSIKYQDANIIPKLNNYRSKAKYEINLMMTLLQDKQSLLQNALTKLSNLKIDCDGRVGVILKDIMEKINDLIKQLGEVEKTLQSLLDMYKVVAKHNEELEKTHFILFVTLKKSLECLNQEC